MRVVDVDAGLVLGAFAVEPFDFWGFRAIAVSPDGTLLAIGGDGLGPPLAVVDITTGEPLAVLQRTPAGDFGAWFSTDSGILYTVGGSASDTSPRGCVRRRGDPDPHRLRRWGAALALGHTSRPAKELP